MGLFNDLGKQISDTFGGLRDKNHRTAVVNRLRIVIRNDREERARAYVALGKYYYEHMRGQGNPEAEALCDSIDESDRRLKHAFQRLEEIREENDAEAAQKDRCTECDSDCGNCQYGMDSDVAEGWAPTEPETPADNSQNAAPADEPVPSESDSANHPQETPAAPAVTPADEEAAPEEPQA
ncbi:hypothetical protein [Caproicibacterium sp. XB2]|jgi:hypothetical protein|uniref:hypothetical protein n=1 Tax=Caproicibacterium TaxID=2834348 RepID=UPI00384ED215